MSDPQQTQDEGTEETFISHLVELRDRIIRAGLAVVVVFVGLVYWAPDIFRLLARPLMQNLPKDGKMIVTDVTGSFFVPMKVTMLVAFGGQVLHQRTGQQLEDVRRPIHQRDEYDDDRCTRADDTVAQFDQMRDERLFDGLFFNVLRVAHAGPR